MTESIRIPDFALVVLIGPSGSGKSTFAKKHFKPTEVLSSDDFRALISDDENDQTATADAFETLHFVARKRLAARKLTVIDATNVQEEARKPLIALARDFHALPVAIVLHLPAKMCHERNRERTSRDFGRHVVEQQARQLRGSLRRLDREGFRRVIVLSTPESVDGAVIERQRLWTDRRDEHGPFDIIGDVHGCSSELRTLLLKLGYSVDGVPSAPTGRKAVFLGDLVDRGPDVPGVLRLVMDMVDAGCAICVPGNHDVKLLRKLTGREANLTHGLAESLAQLQSTPPEFKDRVIAFIDGLVSHYVLDDGKLVVAHAGMRADMQGRASAAVRAFALYGETTGETDDLGLPVRYDWASEYRGKAMVVYGHTPVPEAEWFNRTINIDTGCVFGGKLTALRYPERETVSVTAERLYCEPARPFVAAERAAPVLTAQQAHDDLLDIADVLGKRIVTTRLHHNVTVREENSAAALEVMSRFATNPKWLIYLPPTMSPPETSPRPLYLEHPEEAFAYYRRHDVERVICEEKHMGSRAVVIVCRDEEVARRRFGVTAEGMGVCYTRTGRRFFDDRTVEARILETLEVSLDRARIWHELQTDWACLDCELMPWSAKAQELLRGQYAAVGSASRAALAETAHALARAADRQPEAKPLLDRCLERQDCASRYVEAYRRYSWTVSSLSDFKLAPFHLLATEGAVHVDKDHVWHMEMAARMCRASVASDGTAQRSDAPTLLPTVHRLVAPGNAESEAEACAWWEDLTARGGEGMVVKPLSFLARGARGLVQPAVKCRGREYLRIIYGAEYTLPANLERLRKRSLSAKRALALRELALGIEGLERFVNREPLRRVHECVFGVLALESEPVDPRL